MFRLKKNKKAYFIILSSIELCKESTCECGVTIIIRSNIIWCLGFDTVALSMGAAGAAQQGVRSNKL